MPGLPSLRKYFHSADEALHACVRDDDLQKLQQLLRALPTPDVNYHIQNSVRQFTSLRGVAT